MSTMLHRRLADDTEEEAERDMTPMSSMLRRQHKNLVIINASPVPIDISKIISNSSIQNFRNLNAKVIEKCLEN